MGSCRKRYTWRLSVRIGAFNLENLFDRAKALNLGSWSDGKPILDAYARLNALFAKATYSPADKKRIVDGLTALGLDKGDGGGEYVILRQNRGRLLKRPRSEAPEVVAPGDHPVFGHLRVAGGCRPARVIWCALAIEERG